MMRLNLSSLATTKAKRGSGGARRAPTSSVSIPGEGSGSAVMILVFVILVLGGLGGSYWWADHEHTRLQGDLAKAIAENQRLSEVKAKYDAQKRKSDSFERRLKVIHDLQEAQIGPADVLKFVDDTVNSSYADMMVHMSADGKRLEFQGMALSADAVADLMANLR